MVTAYTNESLVITSASLHADGKASKRSGGGPPTNKRLMKLVAYVKKLYLNNVKTALPH